ncbi:hypothetical protein PGT21_026529 [Puccinia graminis f. sp. tritici]|uniref:Uncharacterized protein n=1 Tax=Puccinia graminis f. sp. tritici TaxID=56615 RepID=A0A5B0LZL8_PUCGR|nr:hypothetical protein PGT21_026529 [Puccinia graminis f. sp. tritici]
MKIHRVALRFLGRSPLAYGFELRAPGPAPMALPRSLPSLAGSLKATPVFSSGVESCFAIGQSTSLDTLLVGGQGGSTTYGWLRVYDERRDVGLTNLLDIHSHLLPLFRDLIIQLVSSLEVVDFENQPIPELSLFPKFAALQHTMEQTVSAVVSVALRPDQPDIKEDGNRNDFKIFRTSCLLEDLEELQDLNRALFEVLWELIQGPTNIDDPVNNQVQDTNVGWWVVDDPNADDFWPTNPDLVANQDQLGNQEWFGNQDWVIGNQDWVIGNQDWPVIGNQDWVIGNQDRADNQDMGANRDRAGNQDMGNRDRADNQDGLEDLDRERDQNWEGNDNSSSEQGPEDGDAQKTESSGKEESWTSKKKQEMISRATMSINFIDATIRRCKQSDFALLHKPWQAAIQVIDHALSFFYERSGNSLSRRDGIARLTRSATALMKVTRVFYNRLSNTSTHLLPFTLPHDVSTDKLEWMLWNTAPLARTIDDALFPILYEINCAERIFHRHYILQRTVGEMRNEFTAACEFLKKYLVPLSPKAGYPSSAPFVFDDYFRDLKDQFHLACDNTIELTDKVKD